MSEAPILNSDHDGPTLTPNRSELEPRRTIPRATPGKRTILLFALLVLIGFSLGGCVTAWMMRNLILRMMAVYQNPTEVLAVYNLLDHLIPYYAAFGALLLLGVGGALITALHLHKSRKPG